MYNVFRKQNNKLVVKIEEDNMGKYNYSKLLGRLTELGIDREKFADIIGIKRTSLYKRLNSELQFKQDEINKAIQALNISQIDVWEYFFNKNV
jgi:putative cro repressor